MAKIIEWTETQKAEWKNWVSTRPPVIQEICKRLSPDRLYRRRSTGHRVTLISMSENNTVTVNVSGKYNSVIFERDVFGIDPYDLEECDLPEETEHLGSMLSNEK
jgi:hypothetical protein